MRRFGGSAANEQLTAIIAAVLLPLLVAEGATLLNIRALLTVHAFIGMLLVPVVALKLASAGWRMVRYYTGSEEYVLRGPPHLAIRLVVAPVLVASTEPTWNSDPVPRGSIGWIDWKLGICISGGCRRSSRTSAWRRSSR